MRSPQALRGLFALLAILCSFANSGCVSSMLANRMIKAPNLLPPPRAVAQLANIQNSLDRDFFSNARRIRIEPDGVEILAAVLEPGNYQLKHRLEFDLSRGPSHMNLNFSLRPRDPTQPPLTPKGTIVLLHGITLAKDSMLHWGGYLAEAGYRVVLLDLRGHGRSTGDKITYGARECDDLSQVLDELLRQNVIAGQVGVLGISYGASVAIQWAARDPRVAAVVGLAPFSDTRKGIHEFAQAAMPKLVSLVSERQLNEAFTLAAQRGNFTWEEIDVVAAARRLRFPLLLFHGKNDTWIPPYHSEALRQAAPAGSDLRLGPGNHLTITFTLDPGPRVKAWFEQRFRPRAAPELVPVAVTPSVRLPRHSPAHP